MHGIWCVDANLENALELSVLVGFDGQLKQGSQTEKLVLLRFLAQLDKAKLDGKEKALVWLYLKTWNAYGEHVIEYNNYFENWQINHRKGWPGLWNFDDDDMEAAFISMAYPKEEDSRTDRLNSRILGLPVI